MDAIDRLFLDIPKAVAIKINSEYHEVKISFSVKPSAEAVKPLTRILSASGFRRAITHTDEKTEGFDDCKWLIKCPDPVPVPMVAKALAETYEAMGFAITVETFVFAAGYKPISVEELQS